MTMRYARELATPTRHQPQGEVMAKRTARKTPAKDRVTKLEAKVTRLENELRKILGQIRSDVDELQEKVLGGRKLPSGQLQPPRVVTHGRQDLPGIRWVPEQHQPPQRPK